MATDSVTIKPCQLCGSAKGHQYDLEVQHSTVFHLMTAAVSSAPQRKRSFTRYFTCPTTGSNFKATISLVDTSDYPISSVGDPTVKAKSAASDD